ncbi:hypothetical protein [Actinomadura yumaensis]|uniref:Uncharacterized protein n=1 Tax=Actinomadura yumaensis TaxID=111807 RepID=A0ABW2CS75_9ACTN
MTTEPAHAPVERHGYRARPTPRHHEKAALAAIAQALSTGAREHHVAVPGGTFTARSYGPRHWRVAVHRPTGQRVALAVLHGDQAAASAARTVAEVIRRAPTGFADGARPTYDLVSVGENMVMRRNRAYRSLRADGTVRAAVPGAQLIIRPSVLDATTTRGGIRLTLDGPWGYREAAAVADAVLRDLAPEARHLTYTTGGGRYYYNESGSRCYDSSSWAHCSCDWHYPGSDQSDARWTAKWHRQHPDAYRTPEEAYAPQRTI